MTFVHETQRVRRLPRKSRHVDIQEAIEHNRGPDFLLRLPFRSCFGPLSIVHETAGDVPVPFRIAPHRLHHQYARSLREDDFGDTTDHRRVYGAFHQRIDVRPFEHGIPSHPLLRVMVEPRGALHDTILAEVHDAVRIRAEWKALLNPRETVLAAFPDEKDLPIRLDEHVPAAPFLGHSSQPCPWPVLNAHGSPLANRLLRTARSIGELTRELSRQSRRRRAAARSSQSCAGPSPTARCRSGSPPSPRTGPYGPHRHSRGRCP